MLPSLRELRKHLPWLCRFDERPTCLKSLEILVEIRSSKLQYGLKRLVFVLHVLELKDVLVTLETGHQPNRPSFEHVPVGQYGLKVIQWDGSAVKLVRSIQDWSDFEFKHLRLLGIS